MPSTGSVAIWRWVGGQHTRSCPPWKTRQEKLEQKLQRSKTELRWVLLIDRPVEWKKDIPRGAAKRFD